MSIWNLSDGTNAAKNEDPQRGWLYEQVGLAISNGYKPIPVIEKEGVIVPIVEYGTNNNISIDDPLWEKCAPNVFSIMLGDCVLVDDDSHKVDNVEQVKVDARPFQFFDGVQPCSFHWLFSRPEGDCKQSYRAPDGSYDLKTGNQLAHIKQVKVQQWYPKSELLEAPEWVIDQLTPSQSAPPTMIFDTNPQERPSVETIISALKHVSPNTDYHTWNGYIGAIHHATEGSEEGLEIAHQWSAQDTDGYDKRLIDRKWKSYRAKSVVNTFGTIVKAAQSNGWILPKDRVEVEDLKETPVNKRSLLNIIDVDVMQPPAEIANSVIQEMNSREHRRCDDAKLAALLQTLKNTIPNRLTPNGAKINIVTLVIAQSAAGKEMPQAYVSEVMERRGLISKVSKSPRSDKDLMQTLLDNRGHCLLNIDEGHSFFNTVSDKNSSYAQNIVPEILSMTGTDRYLFNSKIKREMLEGNTGLYTRKAQLEAKMVKGEDDEVAATEFQLKDVEWRINALEMGIKNPIVSLALTSTPVRMDGVVEATSLEDGFLGRALVFRSSEDRATLNRNVTPLDFGVSELIAGCETQLKPKYDVDAQGFLDELYDWYEADERLNHPILGALYARAIPRIEGLASLVAMGEPLIDINHLRWGMAVFERNIESVKSILVERALDSDSDNSSAIYELIRGRTLTFVKKYSSKSKVKEKVFKVKQLDPDSETMLGVFERVYAEMNFNAD